MRFQAIHARERTDVAKQYHNLGHTDTSFISDEFDKL